MVVKTSVSLTNYKQFAKFCSPSFTAFNRIAYGFTLPMVKHKRIDIKVTVL